MAEQKRAHNGFINEYGTFWSRSEVNWSPGAGVANEFMLLGRRNKVAPALKVCDFREQRGIYILHDDHGPYYVGLARDRDIGHRLKDHTKNHHSKKWDRFSWFGFKRVLKGTWLNGTQKMSEVPLQTTAQSSHAIADMEALLIQVLGTFRSGNRQQANFTSAQKWEQIPTHECDLYLERARRYR